MRVGIYAVYRAGHASLHHAQQGERQGLSVGLLTPPAFHAPQRKHKTSVEGFGIADVEAAQYGMPSLGGKDGGAADAIEHDRTGLICDGNNLDDVYSSLNKMIVWVGYYWGPNGICKHVFGHVHMKEIMAWFGGLSRCVGPPGAIWKW